jgi:para-aminobenzoate synthetase component 1
MRCAVVDRLPWRDPVEVAAPHAERPFALVLLSDGGAYGRWSYLALDPDLTAVLSPDDPRDGLVLLREMLGERWPTPEGAPPFSGGVAGVIAYEYADRLERLSLPRDPAWPDLALARYPAVLAFDHHEQVVLAVGRGDANIAAAEQARRAAAWLSDPPPSPRGGGSDAPAVSFTPEAPGSTYEAAVTDTVERIRAGEIFQANIARAWGGRLAPHAAPFDVLRRLEAGSPAPFSAYLRLEGLALVSHSPERFVRIEADGVSVETRPIKGTRPRGADAVEDLRLADELLASAKDRSENLMIVDLMRNDLSRVCVPGSVKTPDLFRLERYPNVHHLVSTVVGRLEAGRDAADLLAATFPPGSITGAPKIQAMKVIAGHEGPRGAWCGSLFWAGFDGALDSSVLIRTASFVEDADGWRFRVVAGAGIVADSDPYEEREETRVKASGLRRALVGDDA